MLVVNEFLPQINSSIFDTREFFELHRGDAKGYFFQWLKKGKAVAGAHFVEAEGIFRSPRRGTFGGVFAEASAELSDICDFVSAFCELLRTQGNAIQIAMAPEWHSPRHFANQFYALAREKFTVIRTDVDFGCLVSNTPFLNNVSQDIKRRNGAERTSAYRVSRLTDDDFPDAYRFIRTNHEAKGYPVSMTLEQLEQMRRLFPDKVVAYSATREGLFIAAAVCIQIRRDMQHIFLMNNVPDPETTCNTVGLIVQKIYEDCAVNGISRLSYGTATENTTPNSGLIRFKRSLGFSESLKVSLLKNF